MSRAAAESLLEALESNDPQRKVEALHSMKQSIKKESIEVPGVRPLFQSLKLGLTNSNTQVSGQALTTTHGALRRLDIQDPGLLKTALPTILPYLIDRMGDAAEKIPQLARDCLSIAWRSSPQETEGTIKQLGFGHRLARVRDQSVRWTAKMALDKSTKLTFRSFTSYLITSLEDADGTVRETSKQTIIDLYLTVPPHARADLRREMNIQNVRKSTMQHILVNLEMTDGPEINLAKSTSSMNDDHHMRSTKRLVTPSSHAEGSVAGSMASTYVGSLPGSDLEPIDAIHIHSAKDMEYEFSSMAPCFEGRESERNWLEREKNLMRLRGLLRGNCTRDHHTTFIAGVKAILEGIIKGMTSLRTSLCLIGLQFVKDLCIVLGPGVDQFVEQLLATLVKLTGATKKIQGQAANVTINVMIASVSYHQRLLQHLSLAVQDKNTTPRLFATGWLRVLLEAHGDSKHQIEHAGIEALDKSVRRGLADANPGVREGMRVTYWKYASLWPERAGAILATLDGTAKKQLEKVNPAASGDGVALKTGTEPKAGNNRPIASSRPQIKTVVQMERARAALPSIDSIALPRPPTAAPVTETRPELRSGLSSGPQRQGLGGAVRLAGLQSRKVPTTRTEDPLRNSTRSTSSNATGAPTSSSPLRTEAALSPKRRKPITEQLESENWRVRVEGVVTLACLLANKEPPNTDGQKITLPTVETLAPILRKLMADSQAEVVDQLMAPEVIAEIAKIIEWDAILPRVLLMSETDESEIGHDVKTDCLPAVKAMFDDATAVQQCLDTLALLKVAGHLGKPIKPNFRFTTAQKRPIIKAVLVWLIELIERHQEAVMRGEDGNPAFSENAEYKLVMNRTMSMMTNIQPTSMNYAPLATLLKALRRTDESTFDKNLSTFERPVIVALKKAWGEKPTEEEEAVDEPVADVTSVLGSVPVILASRSPTRGSPDSLDGPSPLPSRSSPTTPKNEGEFDLSVCGTNSPAVNEDEDLTMIASQSAFIPKTPAGFRQALHMVDSPWSSNGSPPSSRAKLSDGKENTALNDGQTSKTHSNGAFAILKDSPPAHKKFSGPDIWFRKQMKGQVTHTPLPRALADKIELLDSYISRLRSLELDSSGFRKLIKITKEHPTALLSNESGAEPDDRVDIWDAGARFDHMMECIINHLASCSPPATADLKIQALLLLKTALKTQPQYFAGHECRVLQTIISLRSSTESKSLSSGLDELAPELINTTEPTVGIITVLQTLAPYVVDDAQEWKNERLSSLQMAISVLPISIAQLSVTELEGFAQALSQLIVKALNDEFKASDVEIAEVRRSTVNLCMAMYGVIGDTRVVLSLLRDLKPSQQNLLTYYFANKSTEV